MKMWRPPAVPTEEVWAVQYQMIVPKTYRPDVLSTADETPLPGQLVCWASGISVGIILCCVI